jgi:hypothetical protein
MLRARHNGQGYHDNLENTHEAHLKYMESIGLTN